MFLLIFVRSPWTNDCSGDRGVLRYSSFPQRLGLSLTAYQSAGDRAPAKNKHGRKLTYRVDMRDLPARRQFSLPALIGGERRAEIPGCSPVLGSMFRKAAVESASVLSRSMDNRGVDRIFHEKRLCSLTGRVSQSRRKKRKQYISLVRYVLHPMAGFRALTLCAPCRTQLQQEIQSRSLGLRKKRAC